MENTYSIKQILSSNSSDLPSSVRFKSCLENEFGCTACKKSECKAAGNYDIEGWRYDTVVGYGPLGDIRRVQLKSGIFLHFVQCDFYTMEPPNEGPQAIL
jgi:hypothetical protein